MSNNPQQPEEIFTLFKNKQSPEHIGGITTIKAVVSLVKKNKPKNILEFGGAPGALSYAILTNCDADLDIYEHNPIFANILKENLCGFENRYTIITDYTYLPPKREYDLIIVDGGQGKGDKDGGFPQAVAAHIISLSYVKTIFVEGLRRLQKYWILEALRTKYIYTPTFYRDPALGVKDSLQLDCKLCSSEILRLFNHLYWKKKVCAKAKIKN